LGAIFSACAGELAPDLVVGAIFPSFANLSFKAPLQWQQNEKEKDTVEEEEEKKEEGEAEGKGEVGRAVIFHIFFPRPNRHPGRSTLGPGP
jgi:hypothetical protein